MIEPKGALVRWSHACVHSLPNDDPFQPQVTDDNPSCPKRAGRSRSVTQCYIARVTKVANGVSSCNGGTRSSSPNEPQRSAWIAKRGVLPILGLLIGGDIAVWRASSFIFPPQFWAEGGAVWFADAYNRGPWTTLFHPHAGYVDLFPRIVADLGLLLPLSLVPTFFVSVVLFVQVLPGVFFLTERFSHICPDWRVRAFIALVYFAIPNSFEDSGKLTTVVWRLALLALMVILARPARTLLGRIFDSIVIVVSGLSGPFAIALLPVAGLQYLREVAPGDRWMHLRAWWDSAKDRLWPAFILLLCLATAIWQGIEFLKSNVLKDQILGANLHLLQLIVTGQMFTALLVGRRGYAKIYFHHWWVYVSLIPSLLLLILVVLVVRKGTAELRLLGLYSLLIIVGGLLNPLVILGKPSWPYMYLPGVGNRFWLFPMLFVLVSLVWLVTKWPGLTVRFGAGMLLAVILLVGIPADWSQQGYVNLHYAQQVRKFQAAPKGSTVVIPINPPGWKLILDKK